MSTPVILAINLAVLVVLGLILRAVKSEPTAKGGFNFKYTTSDLVIMAVLGALAGVINTWMGNIWYAANSVSPIYGAALQGTFMWAYILAYFLIRKSGSMLIIGSSKPLSRHCSVTRPAWPRLAGASLRASGRSS